MNTLEARRRLLGRNVYKRTTEGNPAIAQGSLARMYPGITMQGWTEQPQYEGNQLFEASKLPSKTQGGATVTNNGDGSFTITGKGQLTISFFNSISISGDEARKFLRAGTLRTNTAGKVPQFYVYAQDSDSEVLFSTANTGKSELTDEILGVIDRFYYVFYSDQGSVITPGIVWPMVYQDGDGTWEPYTGGVPSPSPDYPQEIVSAGNYDETSGKYKVDITLTGSNLIDFNQGQNDGFNLINLDASLLTTGQTYTFTNYKCNTRVSLYAKMSDGTDDKPLVSQYLNESDSANFEFIDNVESLYVGGLDASIASDSQFMFNPGTTPLPYEPYKPPQTVTLAADRPLTKWDKLEKRNGQWGWVYKSAKKEFDGSADESWEKYSNIGFRIVLGEMKSGTSLDGFCTRFENVKDYIFDKTGIRFGVDNNVMYINTSTITVELQDFKLLLQSNPIKVLFETETSDFVPLSESEQEQMNALHTNRPTTVLSNNQDCEMMLKYKTKKSLEVTD